MIRGYAFDCHSLSIVGLRYKYSPQLHIMAVRLLPSLDSNEVTRGPMSSAESQIGLGPLYAVFAHASKAIE